MDSRSLNGKQQQTRGARWAHPVGKDEMMSISKLIQARQYLDAENPKWPEVLKNIPASHFPGIATKMGNNAPIEAWRSREFLVQVYMDDGFERITVCRTEIDFNGRYKDNVTWDEMQRLKFECGRGDKWAVEIFPPDNKIVNVQNMRHMFLLNEPPAYGWHKKPNQTLTEAV